MIVMAGRGYPRRNVPLVERNEYKMYLLSSMVMAQETLLIKTRTMNVLEGWELGNT